MARSDNWRINKSTLMPVEGAQLLKALRKVAGAAGLPSNFKVTFAVNGQDVGIDFDKREVIIGAGRLFHEAPLPADKMDILTGLMLHEVEHRNIGTDRLDQQLFSSWDKTNPGKEQAMFQKFVNIGEDVVVESSLRANKNLADYDIATHDWAVAEMREAKQNKLLELWIEYGLGHKADAILDLPQKMSDAMAQVVALTGWLRHKPSYGNRANAYLNYWSALKEIILNPPELESPIDMSKTNQNGDGKNENGNNGADGEQQAEDRGNQPADDTKDGSDKPSAPENKGENASGEEKSAGLPAEDGQSESGEEESDDTTKSARDGKDTEKSGEGTDLDRPLAPRPDDIISKELMGAIEEAIQSDSEDITEQVVKEFNGANVQYPIIRSRETKTPLIKPNPELRKRLERVMTIRKRLQARVMHGEQYGRIDKRHLDRIGTDQRIFSLRYKFPDGFPNTKILLDLSGSMSGKQADEVLEAAGALQTLVNAEVWCYNDLNNQIHLVRMDNGKLIHRWNPDGGTPSGLAIIGVSLGMKKDGLIIHLTDGCHNCGQTPWNAHWILKKRGIELVNLIWSGSTHQYDLDGMNWRQLKGLGEFPDALYNILVEKAKLGGIGAK